MSEYQTMIRDLPQNQRPRERLLEFGASALSDTELLAILLRVGSARESVLRLAERLLHHFGSIKGIAQATAVDLSEVKGIGPAKSTELLAAIELGIRLSRFSEAPRPTIRSPQNVYDLFGSEMRYLSQEQFRTLSLDTKGGVIRSRTVTQGSLNASIVEAREVFREAISCNAANLIAIHNHPSGDPSPSQEDISLTKRLVEAGKVIGIGVLDHLIVGDGKFVSLKERGLM
ncbi:MAG TPA: DNA repair protein RadC [Armatimonadota bacterium]|nr:DNA repair protein RadC [Armatimonadota bacterium]